MYETADEQEEQEQNVWGIDVVSEAKIDSVPFFRI